MFGKYCKAHVNPASASNEESESLPDFGRKMVPEKYPIRGKSIWNLIGKLSVFVVNLLDCQKIARVIIFSFNKTFRKKY